MIDFKSYDWRKLKRLLEPQAANDLNDFLERLPQRAGNNALIAAGIAWVMAATIGLYTVVQIQKLTELRVELKEAKAIKPQVPILRNVPVQAAEVRTFAEKLKNIYSGLDIKPQGSTIYISARSTGQYAQFREAVGHVQNGGRGWRVSVEKLCVGRECDREQLATILKINKVSVDKAGK